MFGVQNHEEGVEIDGKNGTQLGNLLHVQNDMDLIERETLIKEHRGFISSTGSIFCSEGWDCSVSSFSADFLCKTRASGLVLSNKQEKSHDHPRRWSPSQYYGIPIPAPPSSDGL